MSSGAGGPATNTNVTSVAAEFVKVPFGTASDVITACVEIVSEGSFHLAGVAAGLVVSRSKFMVRVVQGAWRRRWRRRGDGAKCVVGDCQWRKLLGVATALICASLAQKGVLDV